MSFWHTTNPSAPISTAHPLVYADRLRIRHPGDSGFALGPHVDGGGVERWEPTGYGLGGVYDRIWAGDWKGYDPWDADARLPVQADLYNGAGACSMFRMFQGWLSMSTTGPGEGSLLVNPLLRPATAYFLLRPFFEARKGEQEGSGEEFLVPRNWTLRKEVGPELQGATPGCGQELTESLHPHLRLRDSMVHVPTVRPGDYVAWHCDTIHAVDQVHRGQSDSSVMYIPVCPMTKANVKYLVRQREAFLAGTPGPDFPGGKGEAEHVGRPGTEFLAEVGGTEGLRGMGLKRLVVGKDAGVGEKEVTEEANRILGY
jgi:hypothetical protein